MQVAKVVAPRQIRLEDAPVPSPGLGEVLVRIKALGVRGSDLQYYVHGRIGELYLLAGHILGHDVACVVQAFARAETRSPDFLKTVITL